MEQIFSLHVCASQFSGAILSDLENRACAGASGSHRTCDLKSLFTQSAVYDPKRGMNVREAGELLTYLLSSPFGTDGLLSPPRLGGQIPVWAPVGPQHQLLSLCSSLCTRYRSSSSTVKCKVKAFTAEFNDLCVPLI